MTVLFFMLIGLVFAGLNLFLWLRFNKYLKTLHNLFGSRAFKIITGIIFLFAASCIGTSLLFENRLLVQILKYISNIWMGVMLYALLSILLAEIVTLILYAAKKVRKDYPNYEKFRRIRGSAVIAITCAFVVFGIFHAYDTQIRTYDIQSDKISNDLKIVLVADTHYGYNMGSKQAEELSEMINGQHPDFLLFAGDIIDNSYEALDDPDRIAKALAGIKTTYGSFACYGNHDVTETVLGGFRTNKNEIRGVDTRLDDLLKNSNITLLQDESIRLKAKNDNITIIGRRDMHRPNNENESRCSLDTLTKDLNDKDLNILIDHEPSELDEAAADGIDIDASGHTHDGQVFPGNLTIHLFWENACGMIKKTDPKTGHSMYSVVTSGVGLWGPPIRTFTDSEITVINVHPK